MLQTFKLQNVKCNCCANTIKEKLLDQFGEIYVDLSKEPRQIQLEIDDNNIQNLRLALRNLGYPMVDEKLNQFQSLSYKAKSYVSCSVGKLSTSK